MAKNDQKMAIIWQFFNFFQKILVLMPPKLLCIFWPFVPTYSQSSSHLETILGIKIFFRILFIFFNHLWLWFSILHKIDAISALNEHCCHLSLLLTRN